MKPRNPNTRIFKSDDLVRLREAKRVRYPFSAMTLKGPIPDPEKVNTFGHYCRFPHGNNNEWMFETREARDLFVKTYEAIPC